MLPYWLGRFLRGIIFQQIGTRLLYRSNKTDLGKEGGVKIVKFSEGIILTVLQAIPPERNCYQGDAFASYQFEFHLIASLSDFRRFIYIFGACVMMPLLMREHEYPTS